MNANVANLVRWTALAAVLMLLLVQGGLGAVESVDFGTQSIPTRLSSDVPISWSLETAGAATTLRLFVNGHLDGTTAAVTAWSYVLNDRSNNANVPYATNEYTLLVESEDVNGALFAVALTTFTVDLRPDLFLGGGSVRDAGPLTFATGENLSARVGAPGPGPHHRLSVRHRHPDRGLTRHWDKSVV